MSDFDTWLKSTPPDEDVSLREAFAAGRASVEKDSVTVVEHTNGEMTVIACSIAAPSQEPMKFGKSYSVQHLTQNIMSDCGIASDFDPLREKIQGRIFDFVGDLLSKPVPSQEPVFWYRPRSDGGYEGPIYNDSIEEVRKTSGAWVPLHAHTQDAAAQIAELTKERDNAISCFHSAKQHWTERIATLEADRDNHIKRLSEAFNNPCGCEYDAFVGWVKDSMSNAARRIATLEAKLQIAVATLEELAADATDSYADGWCGELARNALVQIRGNNEPK